MGDVFDISSDAADVAAEDADVDDVLDVGRPGPRWSKGLTGGRRHVPRRVRIGLWVAGAAGLVTAVALAGPGAGPRPEAQPSAPPTVQPATSTPQTDEQADDVANVLALAAHRGPATDFIRQSSPPGACALVKLGHSPTATIARAVRAVLPGFTVMTIARTLDQFTGLCSLEMRSPPTRGAVLIVSIASPGGRSRAVFDSVRIGFETTADASTKYVLTVTRGGWSVLIGATGIGAALPAAQDMLELARQPTLTW